MKRRVVFFILVLLASVSFAQQYTVSPGDTGWELARQYYRDATMWQRIVDMNPFLQQEGRVFEKEGRIILLLKPGEQLVGLEKLGVAPPKAMPISQLGLPQPPARVVEVPISTMPSWVGLLLAALLFAVVIATVALWVKRESRLRKEAADRERQEDEQLKEALNRQEIQRRHERELNLNPITSGPAMVPGGIHANEPERLQSFFSAQATARYAERNPGIDRNTIRVEQIGPIESGTINGEGEVGYLGGDWRPRRINPPGINAYQGRFRFPDGTEEVLQTLMGCMNPVRSGYGEVMRGFTFTPREIVVPPSEPGTTIVADPQPETTNVAPISPAAVLTSEVAQAEDGLVRIEVRQANSDQPAMIRMSGVDDNADMTVEVGRGNFLIRFRPRQ